MNWRSCLAFCNSIGCFRSLANLRIDSFIGMILTLFLIFKFYKSEKSEELK
jgi:hypothetical protein